MDFQSVTVSQQPGDFFESTFGASVSGAFRVSWDQTGSMYVRLDFEGPDGSRNTVVLGPLSQADIAFLGACVSAEAYRQAAAFRQYPYALNFAGALPGWSG